MAGEIQICKQCCIGKPLDMFGSNGRSGLRASCRKCEAERWQDRRLGIRLKRRKQRVSHERLPMPSSLGRPVTTTDIAWVAGFLEGEGSFIPRNKGGAQVTACQVQREPLERLAKILGGRVIGRHRTRARNLIHDWRISSDRARGVMSTIYSLMSPRRKRQIRRALGVETAVEACA